jgi:predicted secreted hydrolase
VKTGILITTLLLIFHSGLFPQEWKNYPYHQPGSVIYFPFDEGVHYEESVEWWYLNGHLKGQQSGDDYSFMVAYFHYPNLGFDGFRIFNLTHETDNIFHQETLPLNYLELSEDSLHIVADPVGGQNEKWVMQTEPNGVAVPFQYEITATQQNGSIALLLDTYKPPLMIGDSGIVNQGGYGNYSFYYSQTGIRITGSIEFNGYNEEVKGEGWIDRQYGNFNPSSSENYEWFCAQLSNGIDITFYTIFSMENEIPEASNYKMCSIYFSDRQDTAVYNFELSREKYAFMPDSSRCYAQQWQFTWNDINLTLSTVESVREVMLPFRFYEGTIEVTGTVNDEGVTGKGFAELLHSYESPDIVFSNPDTAVVWNDEGAMIKWQLLNPDDGNQIHYDLSFTDDGGITFTNLATGIYDTSYKWDLSSLDDSTICHLQLIGSSIDGSITKTVYSDEILINSISGVVDCRTEHSVYVYPNPTSGFVHLNSSAAEDITLFDVNGNAVSSFKYSIKKSGGSVSIDLSSLPDGMYFVEIRTDGKKLVKKVILTKS